MCQEAADDAWREGQNSSVYLCSFLGPKGLVSQQDEVQVSIEAPLLTKSLGKV